MLINCWWCSVGLVTVGDDTGFTAIKKREYHTFYSVRQCFFFPFNKIQSSKFKPNLITHMWKYLYLNVYLKSKKNKASLYTQPVHTECFMRNFTTFEMEKHMDLDLDISIEFWWWKILVKEETTDFKRCKSEFWMKLSKNSPGTEERIKNQNKSNRKQNHTFSIAMSSWWWWRRWCLILVRRWRQCGLHWWWWVRTSHA